MKVSRETIAMVSRVVGRAARTHRMKATCPLPIWDSTGELIGVAIDCDKVMGGLSCVAQATFTLRPAEYADEKKIEAKALCAINAIKSEILVTIKPKSQMAKAG